MFDVRDQCDPERLARAIQSGARMMPRLEVWSRGRRQTSSAPFEPGGTVTADWVTGITRTLNVTVQPVAVWQKYLALQTLELRPFLGVRLSNRLTVECPMGVFPWQPPTRSRPNNAAIQIQCDDYWSWLVNSGRPARVFNFTGRVTTGISNLIVSGGLPSPTITATDTRRVSPQLLDKSRHEVIVEQAAAIGAEALVDRLGKPLLRNIPTLGSPTTTAITGETGTVGKLTESYNLDVFNEVASWSSAQDVDFPEQVAQITWPFHPAHKSRIGRRRKEFTSPLLLTELQAMAASLTILAKESSRAREMTYERLPDPTTDPGDSMLGQLVDGSTKVQQVSKIVTPLGKGSQTVTGVGTQVDS